MRIWLRNNAIWRETEEFSQNIQFIEGKGPGRRRGGPLANALVQLGGTVGKKKLTENLYVQPGSGSRPNLYFSSTDRDPQPCLKHIPAPLGEEPGFTGKGSEGPDPEPAPERETKHGPNRHFLAGRGSVLDTGGNSLYPGPALKKNEPES